MRLIGIIIFSLLFCAFTFAQPTNVHFGANVGTSSGLGIGGATYGFTGGTDYRKGRLLIESDAEVFHLCKRFAACGIEVTARSVGAMYLTSHFAVQGGIRAARYNVQVFGKSSVQSVVGVRVGSDKIVTELNYRKDLTSANRQNIGELTVTGYAKHHIFFRFGSTYSHFYQGKTAMNGLATSLAIGLYKGAK